MGTYMIHENIRKICLSAVFLALGLVLPFLTGQIPEIGNLLLPMHLPILLCGLLCGPKFGLLLGLICPLLRHLLFQMPPLNSAIPMAFELAAYGFIIGFIFKNSKQGIKDAYIALIIAMLGGRVVLALAQILFYSINGSDFSFTVFLAGAFSQAIPGIILQLALVPFLVILLKRYIHV